ncbi:MAG: class I SAM-dependent methyltransferase [Amylibacter sp.]
MSLLDRLFYKSRKFYDDDFDWDTYTASSYSRQLDKIGKDHQMIAGQGELAFDAATGTVTTGNPPLHENALAIFELIGQLKPASVHEAGCGGGDHLGNGSALFPEIVFSGGDRSEGQLALLKQRHPQLAERAILQDLTMPFSNNWPKVDLVYSQAVLMHIHTAVSHFVAFANMINQSSKHIVLMENYQCHNFVEEAQALFNGGHTNWPKMNIYRFDGSHGARIILLSQEDLDYPKLTSDAGIRDGLKVSDRRLKRGQEDFDRAIFGNALKG